MKKKGGVNGVGTIYPTTGRRTASNGFTESITFELELMSKDNWTSSQVSGVTSDFKLLEYKSCARCALDSDIPGREGMEMDKDEDVIQVGPREMRYPEYLSIKAMLVITKLPVQRLRKYLNSNPSREWKKI